MIRGNNVEILTLAENAAFVYWVTGEEKFARFATDIFNVWLVGTYYMNPILDPEKSCGSVGGWEPGGICGYYDYEQEAKKMKKEESKQFIRWCIAAAVYEKKHSAHLAG